MCEADLEPTPWGDSSRRWITAVYPVHDRIAPGATGECVGSGTRLLRGGGVAQSDEIRIREAGVRWVRELAQRTANDPTAELDTETEAMLREVIEETGVTRDIRCVLYPTCTAVHAVQFPDGRGRNSWGTYPDHPIPSGSLEGRRCPASGVRMTWIGEVRDRVLHDLTATIIQWLREVMTQSGLHFGRPVDQPQDSYFPGRPADAPEPGVGERPAGRPPMNIGGGFLGRAAVDNARDQLRTLTSMAIDQLGSAQDTLARTTALVDSVVALGKVVEGNLRAVQGLVTAAIGSGTDVPEPARRLQAQLLAAIESATGDGVTMAMRVKIEQTFSQVAGAIEAAQEYRSIP